MAWDELAQSFNPQMAIEQEILPRMLGIGSNSRSLDDPNRLDRTDDLSEFLALPHALLKYLERDELLECDSDGFAFKAEPDAVFRARLLT